MIIDAYPREGVQFRTKPVYQYDYGQLIKVHLNSLPATYKVEFSNSTRADAVSTVQSTDEVTIPAQFLTSGSPIYAWIVVVDESARTTEYTLVVPVIARARPTDAEPTPEEQSEIEQTIAALNGAVSDVQEIAESIPGTINDALEAAKESGEFDGQDGAPGRDGTNGTDGVSPAVTITDITGGHRVTITDAEHPNGQTFDVMDGTDGQTGPSGDDGYSPTASVSKSGSTATITITDKNGTTTATVSDGSNGSNGQDGQPGADGYSPTASVTKSGSTATITITDKNGTTTATVSDGQNGTNGQDGAPGVGIPSGGTDGQMIVKDGSTDYATKWANQPSVPVQDVQVNGTSILDAQGVANVPVASTDAFGVLKVGGGLYRNSSMKLCVDSASTANIKAGTEYLKPVAPNNQHAAAFYGLAKAAGADMASSSNPVGTYTDAAKSAIQTMLSGPVTVSGTTPSITALPGIQYVCGEVATLDITLPASGCIDVVFESGSTPTVLTITPPTGVTLKWANGFDPTALEADTTYEINIKDGLGVAASWT